MLPSGQHDNALNGKSLSDAAHLEEEHRLSVLGSQFSVLALVLCPLFFVLGRFSILVGSLNKRGLPSQ
jgi:hypothetical protein